MRRTGRIGRALALFGTATAGLLIAHELDYRFVVPDPLHRHDLLLRSGHGYLTHAWYLALAAGLLAIFTATALGYMRGRRHDPEPPRMRWIVARLAVVQAASFVLLEAVERVVAGAPPDDRLVTLTLVGIAVQLAVAVAGASLIALLDRAGHAIAAAAAPVRAFPRATSSPTPALGPRRPVRHLLTAAPRRGPPAPAGPHA